MKCFLKYILILFICVFGGVSYINAEENKEVFCQIGGSEGITIGRFENQKLYLKLNTTGSVELYNCDPFANDGCKALEENRNYQYLNCDNCIAQNETVNYEINLDKNTLEYFTMENCPYVLVQTISEDHKSGYLSGKAYYSGTYTLKFANSEIANMSDENYISPSATLKPVSKEEVLQSTGLNDDGLTYCNYGAKHELKVGTQYASVLVKIIDDSNVEIYNNCINDKCDNKPIKKGGSLVKCKDFFGQHCSTDQRYGSLSYGSAYFPGYLDSFEKNENGNYKCPYLNVYSGNGNNFAIYLSESNVDGAVPPDTEDSVTKEESKEIVEEGTKNIINNFDIEISKKIGVCTDYLGKASDAGKPAHFIDGIFDIAKIAIIIVTIVLTMLDFISASSKDKTELSKVILKNSKRLIVLLILILLPTFIDILGRIAGIDDILCGIK